MAISNIFPAITISFLSILLPGTLFLSAATDTSKATFSKIFAFGDSYTDTGNTHSTTGPYFFGYVSNSPYGSSYFHHSTNRYSDGRLVIDFLTDTLSLPFIKPYLIRSSDFSNGVNFAVAGSTAIDHKFFLQNNVTIDIIPESVMTELMWFDKYLEGKGCKVRGSPECREIFDNALLWVGEIGVNDYAYSFTASLSPNLIQKLAVRTVNKFLQALLEKGAKYIVVQGLPQTGCLPLTLTLAPSDDRDAFGCVASVNKQIYNHNQLLYRKLRVLRRQYPDAVISYADFYSAYNTIMKNPLSYGFTEPFSACCGDGDSPYNFSILATCGSPGVTKACSHPTKYINWDGVHLTEAMYKVVADMFFHSGYCKPTFDVLLKIKRQRS